MNKNIDLPSRREGYTPKKRREPMLDLGEFQSGTKVDWSKARFQRIPGCGHVQPEETPICCRKSKTDWARESLGVALVVVIGALIVALLV